MRINGEPVVELDVKASFLTIFGGLRGMPVDLSADPYTIDGYPRYVMKGLGSRRLAR